MQDFRDNEKKRLQTVATVCILFLRFYGLSLCETIGLLWPSTFCVRLPIFIIESYFALFFESSE